MADIDIGLLFESITITESDSGTVGLGLGPVFDNLTIVEFVDPDFQILNVVSNIIDQMAIVEDITIILIFRVNLNEVVNVFEIAQGAVDNAFIVLDAITSIEDVLLGLDPNPFIVAELTSVVEFVVVGFVIFPLPLIIEPITVTELVFLSISADLSFNDFQRSYPFVEETVHNILVNVFENGSEQRRDKWGATKKRFGLVFAPRTKIEIDAIKTFFSDSNAAANTFFFKNPLDDVTYRVRFEQNSLEVRRVAFGIFQATVNIIEVF